MTTLNEFKRRLCQEAHGRQPDGRTCVQCNQAFSNDNTWSEAGWRETQISGLCERCFDSEFADEEES